MKNTRMLALILLLIALVGVVWQFWSVVMLFFTAAVIAYLLGPVIKLFTFKGKVRRGLAVAATALVVVGLITWGLTLLIPYAVTQITGVVNDLAAYASSYEDLLQQANQVLASWHLPKPVLDWLTNLLSESDTYLMNAFRSVLSGLMGLTTSVFNIVIVVILIVYFMLDGAKMIRGGIAALPEPARRAAVRIVEESNRYIWKYVGTRVLISLGMAIVTYIGFTIIGLRYAALFALLSLVMDFIPYFGSLIAGVAEGVFALVTGGIPLVIKVVIFVLVVQQIEGNVVAPKVQGEAVKIHPLWVMFSLLVCSKIWGPIGMLISTPVAVVVRTVLREVYAIIIGEDVSQPAPAPANAAPLPDQAPPAAEEAPAEPAPEEKAPAETPPEADDTKEE